MRIVCIAGGSSADAETLAVATETGKIAASLGFAVLTGGRGGVMEAALKGAKSVNGITLGVLPGYDKSEANDFCDLVIPTGLGHARNTIVASSGDVFISIGGEEGTVSETALAIKMGKIVYSFNSKLEHKHNYNNKDLFLQSVKRHLETL